MSATLQDDVPLDNTYVGAQALLIMNIIDDRLSFGAVIIGVIVSAVLHGVCLLQAFYYFQSALSDIEFQVHSKSCPNRV